MLVKLLSPSSPLLLTVFVSVSALAFALLNSTQPEPYMDEIFHVPQAVRYCEGRFGEWDSKITTLPGLYLFSVGVLRPVRTLWEGLAERAVNVSEVCTTANLRAVNLAISVLNFVILNRIVAQIHGGKHVSRKKIKLRARNVSLFQYYDEYKAALSAFNMSFFPLLYFFSFLYYTDVGSTFMVLLMYCLHLDGNDWMASAVGKSVRLDLDLHGR